MTLIVAHVSPSGAVMAADSHVTEEDSTAGSADKIWMCGGLLFGYSGSVSVRDRLQLAIEEGLASAPMPLPTECEMAQSQLCALTHGALKAAYDNYVGSADPTDALGGSLVVVGRDTDKYWLLEIDRNNTPTRYTDDGFHTIGSGSGAAHVGRHLLAHYSLPGYDTKHLRLLATRTVQSCIDVLGGAYGLGGPVQLWQSTDDSYERIEDEELAAVLEGLDQWIQIEQESLLKVFTSESEQVSEPLPEDLSDEGSSPSG